MGRLVQGRTVGPKGKEEQFLWKVLETIHALKYPNR